MCRVRRLVALALLASPAPATAQSIAEMERRLDSLRVASERARAALEAYRAVSQGRNGVPADSLTIADGRIVLRYAPPLEALAKASAARINRQLSDLGALIQRLPAQRVTIEEPTESGRAARERIIIGFDLPSGVMTQTVAPRNASDIAIAIVDHVSPRIADAVSTPLRRWRAGPLPLDSATRANQDWSIARFELVSSYSPLGRSCHNGDLGACRRFLGLDTVPDPIVSLFDKEGRRGLVERRAEFAEVTSRDLTRRCRELNDDDACVSVLRLIENPETILSSDYGRLSLVMYALSVGGPKAAERLLAPTTSAMDALEHASGSPVDDLIGGWQHEVRSRSIDSAAVSVRLVLVSLAWTVVLFTLAIRSGRWR